MMAWRSRVALLGATFFLVLFVLAIAVVQFLN
jgi:hypothetical protein